STTQFTRDYCRPHARYHMYGRCCLDSSNKTIGIDLGNCSITGLPAQLNTVMDVTWINLAHNPKLNCTDDKFSNVFKGFQNLETIVLPIICHECPGGDLLWRQSHVQDNSINCTGQLDDCQNRTCPTNSHCVSNGPGKLNTFSPRFTNISND
ncbi:hypothetical protein QZH41_013897, partial [Actinostola sp. cb2023]